MGSPDKVSLRVYVHNTHYGTKINGELFTVTQK